MSLADCCPTDHRFGGKLLHLERNTLSPPWREMAREREREREGEGSCSIGQILGLGSRTLFGILVLGGFEFRFPLDDDLSSENDRRV